MKKTFATILVLALSAGAGIHAFANPPHEAPGQLMQMAKRNPEERMQKHLEAFKSELKLTADQDRHWAAFEAAMKSRMDDMKGMKALRDETRSMTGIDSLHRRADMMARMAAQQKAVADAAKPLYDSLDASQKTTFDRMLARHGQGKGRR